MHTTAISLKATKLGFLMLVGATIVVSCSHRSHTLRSETNEEGIAILEGDSAVLFYQIKPKSLNGRFERSSYVHPLYSLDGNVITEDFPDDHRHHHGIYSAWHQVLIGDKQVADGWTNENFSLEVVNATCSNEKGRQTINSEVLWKSSLKGGPAEGIVRENLTITVYPSTARLRIIDFDMHFIPLKDSVALGGSGDEKGYGGFSFRLKLPDDLRFIAREKEVQPQVVAVNAGPWMNFTGSFDGKGAPVSGVVVFCHPSNPGSPHPWILRQRKSMQNAAFPGSHPVALTSEGLHLRYRLVVYRDALSGERIDDLFKAYSAPGSAGQFRSRAR